MKLSPEFMKLCHEAEENANGVVMAFRSDQGTKAFWAGAFSAQDVMNTAAAVIVSAAGSIRKSSLGGDPRTNKEAFEIMVTKIAIRAFEGWQASTTTTKQFDKGARGAQRAN